MAPPKSPPKGESKQPPIIIKKKKRGGKHEHTHSSAWKIAYADFVTAMMAFFLLMWLINTMSNEQKKGISEYFDPIGESESASGAGGVLGGRTVLDDGAMQDVTATPQAGPPVGARGNIENAPGENEITPEEEEREFEEVLQKIQAQVEQNPELQELSENLMMDITDEGLQIQLVDRHKKPMFASASSVLYTNALKLLTMVGQSILSVPNKLSISGHTDAFRYSRRNGYSNWELSADRANAARRSLEQIIGAPRISEVIGKAATEPMVPENPNDPINRRISIVLVRRAGGEDKAGPKKARPQKSPSKAKKEKAAQKQAAPPPKPTTTKLFQ